MSNDQTSDAGGDPAHIVTVVPEDASSAEQLVSAALALGRPGLSIIATAPEIRILIDSAGIPELLDALAAPKITIHALLQPEPRVAEPFPEFEDSEQDAAYLDLALDSGNLGLWHWDLRTDEVAWSRQLEVIHGMAPGSFAGTFAAFSATVHPDDRDIVTASIAHSIDTGNDLINSFRFLRADGSVGWMRGSGRLLTDAQGRPSRFVGVAIDQTVEQEQRFQIEQQLRDLEAAVDERSVVASLLRQTLLPPAELAKPDGLFVDAAYVAATTEATGDFYDFFPTATNDEWVLAIGDIAGHGPEASILTGSVRRSLQSAAALTSDPSAILQAANHVHTASGFGIRFATVHAVMLRSNPDATVDALIATAGHPPLLVRRDGLTEWHAGTGPPLGIVPDAQFKSKKIRLRPGDFFVAYTDGVTEAGASRTDLYGEDRLQQFVERSSRPTAASILDAAQEHAGDAARRDDAAVVVIGIEP